MAIVSAAKQARYQNWDLKYNAHYSSYNYHTLSQNTSTHTTKHPYSICHVQSVEPSSKQLTQYGLFVNKDDSVPYPTNRTATST